MKYTLLILAASVALAADPPKPKPLPDAEKVRILDARSKYLGLLAEQQAMLIRANKKMEDDVKPAGDALNVVWVEAMRANGCSDITPDLQCVPPVPAKDAAKAEKK